MALLPLLLCVVGTGGLFFLDRDKSVRSSRALWIPVTWFWIVGSRPVSSWLGISPSSGDYLSQQLDGSPADRLGFQILLAAGLVVLFRRSRRTQNLLRANILIIIYFVYCLLSVFWSDFPDVTFKRWIKAIGDLVMVLVVATDAEPIVALKRLLSRTGFVLLPASVFLIKYSDLGRGYDPDGNAMNTGVTTNKNTLGVVTLVLLFGVVWRLRVLLRAGQHPERGRHLLAQGTLLAFGLALLAMAHSATSVACFAVGTILMLATDLRMVRRSTAAVHSVVLVLAVAAGLTILLGGQSQVTHTLGRESDFTGRTQIWAAVLRVASNQVLGAGFETFWLGPRLQMVWAGLSKYMHVNEAHNGYLEIYLNLGWVGACLIATILVDGYRRAVAAFRWDPGIGSLILAYVTAAALYSVTEAGFRMLNPIWLFLLMALVASGVRRGGACPIERATPKRAFFAEAVSGTLDEGTWSTS